MDDLTGLIAFLRARYDEREQLANRAMRGPWYLDYIRSDHAWQLSGTSDPYGILRIPDSGVNKGTVHHIAGNDPTYVLADIAAKRRILDLAVPVDDPYDDEQVWYQQAITDVIRHMALPDVRAALDAHLNEHGCGTGDHRSPNYVGGFGNCPTARALWDLLPPSDQVLNA